MRTTPTPATPLLPELRDALARCKATPTISVATGFVCGDLLHLLGDVAGHRKGDVLEVAGQCLYLDADGQPYGLRAYVRPSRTQHVPFANRTAVRFREAGQQERLLGNERLLFVTEIDITDHAHELALERPVAPAVALSAPALPLYQLAPRLRKAA